MNSSSERRPRPSGPSRGPKGSGAKRQGSGGGRGRSGAGGGRTSGGPPRKYRSGESPAGEDEPIPGNRQWGGLARKGVLRANHDEAVEREHQRSGGDDADLDEEALAKRAERERRRVERSERQEALRAEARAAVERVQSGQAAAPKRKKRTKPPIERPPLPPRPAHSGDERTALTRLLGAAEARKKLRKLHAASEAFAAERHGEALRLLAPLVEIAPSVPELRELNGLTLYRMGKFVPAARELEAFRELAASTEQNPVLADCYRAQERWSEVDALWNELVEVSPSAAIVNEGRIVMAGALADQGRIDEALRLLEKGWKRPSRPADHHLRRAYALADLYERSGDVPRARALFDWILSKDQGFVDTRSRLRNLR